MNRIIKAFYNKRGDSMKQYTLSITYQYVSFETEYEKTKVKEISSDDLADLVDILITYVNGFMLQKKLTSWMYLTAKIKNNRLISYDPEYVVYEVSLEKRD